MNNLFLTGKIGIGKTTVLKEVLEGINLSIGGYTTERIIDGPMRIYTARSLYDDARECTLAKIDSRDWSKEIFTEAFNTEILSILDDSFKDRDLIVLDELGFVENDIHSFTSKIYELLDSDKIIFGILKDYDCEFLNNIRARKDVVILNITEQNRDSISGNALEILKSFGAPIKREM